MASNGIANGGFAFSTPAVLVPNGLSKIKTKKTVSREVCKDGDTAAAPLKGVLQNVDDLHALQKKKASAPSTPKSPMNPSTPRNMTPRAAYTSEEERHKQQMESIRYQAPPTPSQIMRVQYSCTAFYCTIFRPFAVHHWHR
jgi:phosphoenolpyruvate carboxykinase (ATP)